MSAAFDARPTAISVARRGAGDFGGTTCVGVLFVRTVVTPAATVPWAPKAIATSVHVAPAHVRGAPLV